MGKMAIDKTAVRDSVIAEFKKDRRPCAVAGKFGLHHNTVKRWLADEGLWPPVSVNGGRGGASPDKAYAESAAQTIAGWIADADDTNLAPLAMAIRRRYMLALLRPGRPERATPAEAAAVVRAMNEITGGGGGHYHKGGEGEAAGNSSS